MYNKILGVRDIVVINLQIKLDIYEQDGMNELVTTLNLICSFKKSSRKILRSILIRLF
jgi:hypothetical protein